MVVFSILSHAEVGSNDHWEDTPHFIWPKIGWPWGHFMYCRKGNIGSVERKIRNKNRSLWLYSWKTWKRRFALEDNLETALHKILEQQNTIKKLSYAQVTTLPRGLHPKMTEIQFAQVLKMSETDTSNVEKWQKALCNRNIPCWICSEFFTDILV